MIVLTLAVIVLAGIALERAGEDAAHAQQAGREVETIQLRPNVFVIAGAGANISVQTGPDGAVLVDAGTEARADAVAAAERAIADQPIRYVIDTTADADHVGGNGKLARAGRSIFAMGPEPLGGEFAKAMTNGFAASILAAEGVLLRMSGPTGRPSPFPNGAWPTETFAESRRDLSFDLSGSWPARNYGDALSNMPGPGAGPVDFMGIPFNDAARERPCCIRSRVSRCRIASVRCTHPRT